MRSINESLTTKFFSSVDERKSEKKAEKITDFRVFKTNINAAWKDNTLFIKNIIDSGFNTLIHIHRPPGFGKTLALSMLEYFLGIENHSHAELFYSTAIWNAGTKYREAQGSHPILSLSFSSLQGKSYEEFYQQFQQMIVELYCKYSSILLSDKYLTSEEAKEYQRIMTKQSTKIYFELALKNIVCYLFRIYRKPIIVLIDDADNPFRAGLQYGYYTILEKFMNVVFARLAYGHPYLANLIVASVLPIPTVRSNMFRTISFLLEGDKYALSHLAPFVLSQETSSEKTLSCGGYQIGKVQYTHPSSTLFHSESTHFLEHYRKEINEFIKEFSEGKTVKIIIDEDWDPLFSDKPLNKNRIASLLMHTGFLTVAEEHYDADTYNTSYFLQIPNSEAQLFYQYLQDFDRILFYLILQATSLPFVLTNLILKYSVSYERAEVPLSECKLEEIMQRNAVVLSKVSVFSSIFSRPVLLSNQDDDKKRLGWL